jgi:hypothetical protein
MLTDLGGKLGSLALSYVSIGAAISVVTRGLMDMRAAAEDSAQKAQQAAPGLGELAQLAETPEDMQRLLLQARMVHARGGGDNLNAAAKLVFALESAGATSELDMFTNLRRTGLVNDPASMAKSAKTLQESMGTDETGNFADLVSKAFGASKYSPATAESILEGAARGGTSARVLRMRDEEVIAATAQVSAATGSADTAGTYVSGLLRSLASKEKFAGVPLATAVQQIGDEKMSEADLMKYLGTQEAVNAYRLILADTAKFQEIVEEVGKSQQEQRVWRKLELADTDPSLSAAQNARTMEALEEETRRMQGTFRNLEKAIFDREVAAMRAQGQNEVWIQIAKRGAQAATWFRSPEAVVQDYLGHEMDMGVTARQNPLMEQIQFALQQRDVIQQEIADITNRSLAGPASSDQTPVVQAIHELRDVNQQQLDETRAGRQTLPRAGASAAAAVPTSQRLGR